MPEKLLTIKEAAELLGISEHRIKKLAKKGELPAYQIGGRFLRFRKEQIEAMRNTIPAKPAASPDNGHQTRPQHLVDAAYSESPVDRLSDFFYFNNFYIIAGVIALLILWFIFKP